VREVAGEALLRLVKLLGPMYAGQGESLRSKAAATLAHLATDCEENARAIAQLGSHSRNAPAAYTLRMPAVLGSASSGVASLLLWELQL
jgi:hypothetical protein